MLWRRRQTIWRLTNQQTAANQPNVYNIDEKNDDKGKRRSGSALASHECGPGSIPDGVNVKVWTIYQSTRGFLRVL